MAQILTEVRHCTKPYVYILLCANGEYYVGSTTNLPLRMKEHQEGIKGSRFTKSHHPVRLVYFEEHDTIEDAHWRERQLHGWSRAKKEKLISGEWEKQKAK